MTATDTDLADLFASPTLSDHRAMTMDLSDALGAALGKEWGRLEGVSFVAAHTDLGRRVVIGNGGGWFAVCSDLPDGEVRVSEPLASADAAVRAVLAGSP